MTILIAPILPAAPSQRGVTYHESVADAPGTEQEIDLRNYVDRILKRWWIVAMIGEVIGDDEKCGALVREIIGECL